MRADARPGSFEFCTEVMPNWKSSPPGEAHFFAGDPGVTSFVLDGEDWASIPVTILDFVEG